MNKFETIVFAATKSAFMKNNMVSDNQTIINNNINNNIIKNNNNINKNENIIEVSSNKKTNAGQNCGEARAPSNYKNLNESGKNKNNSDINNNNKEYNDKHGINNNNNNKNNNNNSNNDNIDNKKISDIDLLDNEDGDISTTAAATAKTTISRTTQDDQVTSVESANDLELDLASTDEIKVYKDEGDDEEGGRSVENLSEEKLDLVIETEEAVLNHGYPDTSNIDTCPETSVLKH
ncbi:hypothetical protein HELRODRAFT_164054 [Helobdella robusta]|uniref:CTNNB1 binding N-teminal domain-containing protein n=1 Tax=Helobdella robusta TaxID=6412 RepID=T1EUU4_HELRO|nr:hypothetical protein HELRODRAFT_164054 [Helobdella robusta]ESN94249.1 hypothetical protein HELRODRAFT_164054 [Helobdella robusta]